MGEVKYVAVYAEETFICLMALGGEAKKVFLASCSISQYTYSPHQPINISAFWTLNCDVMDEIYTEQLCSYSIICNKFTCKDDVMLFFCYWRCTEKGQLHNLQWQKPSWEGSYIVCHLQTFAIISWCFKIVLTFSQLPLPKNGAEVRPKLFQQLWQVLPWLPTLPHVFLLVLSTATGGAIKATALHIPRK